MHEEKRTHSLVFASSSLLSTYVDQRLAKNPTGSRRKDIYPRLPTPLYFFIRSVSLPLISVLRQVHGNVVCFLSRQLTNARTWSGIASTIPWLHLGLGLGPYRRCPYTNAGTQKDCGTRIHMHRHSRRWFVRINNHKDSLNSRFDSII